MGGGYYSCPIGVTVGVVQCDGFLLWRLPYVPTPTYPTNPCDTAYCTANGSGL